MVWRDTPQMVAVAPGPSASLTAASTRLGLLTPVLLTVVRCWSFCTRAHLGTGRVGCKPENRCLTRLPAVNDIYCHDITAHRKPKNSRQICLLFNILGPQINVAPS